MIISKCTNFISTFVFVRRRHTAENPPPFPTYFETDADKQQQVTEAFHDSIHHFEDPNITFVETEAEKRVVRTGAKLAKVRTKS